MVPCLSSVFGVLSVSMKNELKEVVNPLLGYFPDEVSMKNELKGVGGAFLE